MAQKTYAEKLKDPRWHAKRNEIVLRDNCICRGCQEKFDFAHLEVHHTIYLIGKEPWDYENKTLLCLCHKCHGNITDDIEAVNKILSLIQQKNIVMFQTIKPVLWRFLENISEHPAEEIDPEMFEGVFEGVGDGR